nr:substrate-binding domain-containing protein [Oceanococcus sp. HetDA_MAG_MS8]
HGNFRGAARRQGFREAMRAAGLSDTRILRVGKPPLTIEDGAEATKVLLERFPDTDCVFCVSDVPAFGMLSALTALGLNVPGDIGLAGFGDFEVSRFASPSITTVVVDPKRIGGEAGRLIGRLLADGVAPQQITLADPSQAMLARCADLPVRRSLSRLEDLPFQDGAYAIVTCAWALETVPDPIEAL